MPENRHPTINLQPTNLETQPAFHWSSQGGDSCNRTNPNLASNSNWHLQVSTTKSNLTLQSVDKLRLLNASSSQKKTIFVNRRPVMKGEVPSGYFRLSVVPAGPAGRLADPVTTPGLSGTCLSHRGKVLHAGHHRPPPPPSSSHYSGSSNCRGLQ